jgi:tetratricopeptide (TPR) repeat protein
MAAASDTRSRVSRYTLGAEAVLAVLLAFAPLAFGSGPLWVLWPVGGLAGLALVLACVGARRQGQAVHLPLLALPLAVSALLCLLQLLPLPEGLLRVLSPEAAALRDFALVPLGLEGPRPLSLDPAATWRALSLTVSCLLVLVAAVQVCRSRRARRRLLTTLAATGAGLATLGLGHALFGVEQWLGVFSFAPAPPPPLVTPFVNPNHLSAFLGLSSTVALGLALTEGTRARAAAFSLAAVLGGVGVLLSLSRGGIAFFILGQLALAGLLVWQRREGEGGKRAWGLGAAALLGLLAVLGVGAYAASERLAAEWAGTGGVEGLRHSKVALWPMMVDAARAFPVTGMGRGAFEVAFPRYQTVPASNTFTVPENGVLQLATEFGVPGLLVLAAWLWGFGRLLRRERLEPMELAVLAGVVGLGLHDLFDFSLELPACAVAVLVALATVARPERHAGTKVASSLCSTGALAVGLGLTALALGALVPGRHSLEASRAELTALVSTRAPLAEVRARGVALIDRHPADSVLYGLLSRALAEAGPAGASESLAFANRALYLRPHNARAHRMAARALLTLGHRTQAFLEYRLAGEAGDATVLKEALPRARTLEELRALTPGTVPAAEVLLVAVLQQPGRQEEALAWLAWARERFEAEPEVVRLWEREARLRLDRRELALAEAASAEVSRRLPDALGSHLLRAEVRWAAERREEAVQSLEALRVRFPGEVQLAFTLARYQLAMGLTRRARETLQQAAPFLSDVGQREHLFRLEGESYKREGHLSRALEAWQGVVRLNPSAEAWLEVARLHESLHQLDAAARAVREGSRLLPPERRAEADAWGARLEQAERERVEARRRERLGGSRETDVLLESVGGEAQAAEGAH